MRCRHCDTLLDVPLIDLGETPPSNAYLSSLSSVASEVSYPLRVWVCQQCWLVQTEDFTRPEELFTEDYAYLSSYSSTWLNHCKAYVGAVIDRFKLTAKSQVIELAANDGYLLQYFLTRDIPCVGIEPTKSTASIAKSKGIPIIEDFFGTPLAKKLAKQDMPADLMISNNVLAHVPDINDFTRGISILLKATGVATFEFPSLMALVENNQFDTIYHEHFSYLSLSTVTQIFHANGLDVFDVEDLKTHGGSLRVYAQRLDTGEHTKTFRLKEHLISEQDKGVFSKDFYVNFQKKAEQARQAFKTFLMDAKKQNKTVLGYGAAAKGNTLINFSGVNQDLLRCIVDKNPSKQGKYTPGSHIPICSPHEISTIKPDYVVILPWNLKEEIVDELQFVRGWHGKFVTAIPSLEIIE